MTNRIGLVLPALAALSVAIVSTSGCAASSPGAASAISTPETSPPAASAPAEPTPPPPKQGTGRAIIHTTEGTITVTFFPDVAPRTVAHITDLMSAGCYEGVDVFRLEPNFVAQIAPVSNAECHADAMTTIPAEFSQVSHGRLYLSMARWDAPDSATSSFSIMLGDVPAMDGEYTVFGRVVAGEDTVQKIEAIGSTKGEDGMSLIDRKVTITRIEVVDM